MPWFGDLDYWYHAASLKGELPEKYLGDGYFQLARDLNVGFYLQGFFPFNQTSKDVTFSEKREGEKLIRTMSTPKGELIEIQQFLPTSSSWGNIKHYVGTEKDLPAFKYYIENIEFTAVYDEAYRRKNIIGDNGVVLCYTPRSPFMQMVTTYTGIENLVYLLADVPDEMMEIFEIMEHKHDIAAKLTIDSPAECIMIPENLSSEVVGNYYYNHFMCGYESRWIQKIREVGKYSFIHMDGTLKGLIRQVAQTGFDVIEAVTPKPSGDMTMEEVTQIVPENTIIWGGLPGIVFTPIVSEKEFVNHVKYVLAIMKREPRFVLGVADQVPPDGLLERVGMVSQLCDEFGRY